MRSGKNFGVYEEVANMGQNALSVHWVVTEKESKDGKKKIKAQLIARGFEEKEEVQSDSPTVSKEMLRSFIAILSSRKWEVNSIDIKAAFLQSERFECDMCLSPLLRQVVIALFCENYKNVYMASMMLLGSGISQ